MTVTPARTRARSSATCRRCGRPGSSPCRASGRSSRPGWRRMLAGQPDEQRERGAAGSTPRSRKVELEQAGEPVPDDLARDRRGGRRASCSPACARCSGSTRPSRSTSARRRRRARCSSSSTRSASRSPSCGACRRPAAPGTVQPARAVKIGTVGPPAPGVEIKLADDGELLIRADVVMTGYRNLPEKTAEALDADGWLHTGDIARVRRGRLPPDRRPQEGDHHQRGRQEHVAGQHRVDAEGRQPADRPGRA